MSCPIIAYTFEADYHCLDCTEKVHEVPMTSPGHLGEADPDTGEPTWTDSEGNEAHPVFSWDEWHEPGEPLPQSLVCGTCYEVIETLDE